MEAPENFKLDVRVRDRMLAKGTVTEAEVKKHLDALPDRDGDLEVVEVVQPAVMPPGERPPVSARPAPRPAPVSAPLSAPVSVAPPPMAVDEGWGDDDDLDEDEEDEDEDEEGNDEGGEGAAKKDDGAGTPDEGSGTPDGGASE